MPLRTISFIYHKLSCLNSHTHTHILLWRMRDEKRNGMGKSQKSNSKSIPSKLVGFLGFMCVCLCVKGAINHIFGGIFFFSFFFLLKNYVVFDSISTVRDFITAKMLNTLTVWPLNIKISSNCEPFNTFGSAASTYRHITGSPTNRTSNGPNAFMM